MYSVAMDLREAEKTAKRLMTEHGVGYMQFAFDGGKRRLGACHMMGNIPFKITLSKHYVALLPEDEVVDVILHEIAHALTPGQHHNAVWQNAARKIGAKGTRCATPSARPEHPIEGVCPNCDKVVSKHHRLPRRVYFGRCCGQNHPLTYRRDGAMLTLSHMPASYREEYVRNYR